VEVRDLEGPEFELVLELIEGDRLFEAEEPVLHVMEPIVAR
jgi:hypothetical protein